MRRALVDGLVELACEDERVVLLTGDLGFAALEPFAERFPNRFFNVGVCEQNMVGMATGLAEAGFTPYVYSIATFASMRPYEFVRNGPVLHDLPVKIIGIGGGFDYGHNGMTHYALEDVGLMRIQPNMTIVAPADDRHVRPALHALQRLNGPAYLRLTKRSVVLDELPDWFELGRAYQIGYGGDVALIALGGMASTALECRELLSARGMAASVIVVSSVSPPPVDDLVAALRSVPLGISVEEHYVTGGVGSLVAEVIAEHGLACRLVRVGVRDIPLGVTGSREYVHEQVRLSASQIAEACFEAGMASRADSAAVAL